MSEETLSQEDAARLAALSLADIESQVLTSHDLDAAEKWLEKFPYTHTALRALATVLRDRWDAPEMAAIVERVLPTLAQHESEVC